MNTQRIKNLSMFFAAAFIALSIPAFARAQGGYYDPYNRNSRYPSNYDQRALRDAVRRVKDRSKNFQKDIDRYFDRNGYENSRYEERGSDLARDFRYAAERLQDRSRDGRDINNSYNEARNLLNIGSRIERFAARNRLDSRSYDDWAQIRQNLNTVANIYGINWSYDNDNYRRGNYDPRYPYPNDRGRFPFPFPRP
ncbi:MAG: hypothetical protein NVSMB56_17300 [Pyrinomonadaceae bacterium]